ncbi:MAG: SUMF1/EgtB/PvdO family nonheme iron enzyme [Bacteroidales bacterium]|nr:SUMF1/EgtB/PvdO family nonheme iron enzyme [Bacteroidales bacterium]
MQRLALLLVAMLTPLLGVAQWSEYELDTTLWGGGLPYGVTEGFNLPFENSSEPSYILTFIPTDTASVADGGKWVTFKGFWMMSTEVSVYLWGLVMDAPENNDRLRPISMIDSSEVALFIHRIDSITGMPLRLPTVEEWWFAAKGGHRDMGYHFGASNKADFAAWWSGNSGGTLHAIASRLPNEAELFDMMGNVAEMAVNSDGRLRLMGGHYNSNEAEMTNREGSPFKGADPTIGFRLVCTTQRTFNSMTY